MIDFINLVQNVIYRITDDYMTFRAFHDAINMKDEGGTFTSITSIYFHREPLEYLLSVSERHIATFTDI